MDESDDEASGKPLLARSKNEEFSSQPLIGKCHMQTCRMFYCLLLAMLHIPTHAILDKCVTRRYALFLAGYPQPPVPFSPWAARHKMTYLC